MVTIICSIAGIIALYVTIGDFKTQINGKDLVRKNYGGKAQYRSYINLTVGGLSRLWTGAIPLLLALSHSG